MERPKRPYSIHSRPTKKRNQRSVQLHWFDPISVGLPFFITFKFLPPVHCMFIEFRKRLALHWAEEWFFHRPLGV